MPWSSRFTSGADAQPRATRVRAPRPVGPRRGGEHPGAAEDRPRAPAPRADHAHRDRLGGPVGRAREHRGVEAHPGLLEHVEEGVADGVAGGAEAGRRAAGRRLDGARAADDLGGHRGGVEPGQIVAVRQRVVLDRVAGVGEAAQRGGALRPAEVLADGEERHRQALLQGEALDAAERDVVDGVRRGARKRREPVDGGVVVDLVEIHRDGREASRSCHACAGARRRGVGPGASRGAEATASETSFSCRPSSRPRPRSRPSGPCRCPRRARSGRSASW